MAKKNYQQARSDRSEIREYFYEILKLTPSFEAFLQEAIPRHQASCQWEGQDSNLPKELREYSPSEMESPDEVFVYRLMVDFVSTPKGQEMARRLGLLNISPAVRVIPHERGIIKAGNQGREFDISPHLEGGRYLYLRLDLTRPREHIRQEIDRDLDRYKPHVTAVPEAQPVKIKQPRIKNLMERKILAYVKHQAGETKMQIARRCFPDIGYSTAIDNPAANIARNTVTSWIDEISTTIKHLED